MNVDPSDVAEGPGFEEVPAEVPTEATHDSTGKTTKSISDLLSSLLNTESPEGWTVDDIQREYGISKPRSMVIFGLMKMANSDGMPAIADICMGLFLELGERKNSNSASSDLDETEEEIRI